jgi:hypothetical protein
MEPMRPLYSAVVSDNTDEIDSNIQSDLIDFGSYEAAMESASKCIANSENKSTLQKHPKDLLRSQFLEELAGHMAAYIVDVKDALGFHGFANDLELYDIMQCLESNMVVDSAVDSNGDALSDEDDVN